jgi:cell division protein FtsI (penicillin-binding protein 3)
LRSSIRHYFVVSILMLLVIVLVYRLMHLTIQDRSFLQNKSAMHSLRMREIPVRRGNIYDRNDKLLAASVMSESLWINPKDFVATKQDYKKISDIIGVKVNVLTNKVKANKAKEFIYLKRHMAPRDVAKVKIMHLAGVNFQKEYKRYYPDTEILAHLVGVTDIDDIGQEGLELSYNRFLQGKKGKKVITLDRLGRTISEGDIIEKAVEGKDLHLSIDRGIQYVAYSELMRGAEVAGASSASVVVMDIATGEVLSLANYPSYNPNDKGPVAPEVRRNRAITDLFEPGSTMKPFSLLYALDSNKYHMDDKVYIGNGEIKVDGNTIHDAHVYDRSLSLTEIIKYSSNVGIVKVMMKLSPDGFIDRLRSYGFGEMPGSGFPGEARGGLPASINPGSIDHASIAYGYGVSASLLQLMKAYRALLTGGNKDISLLRLDAENAVLNNRSDDKNVTIIKNILGDVTSDGTGKKAKVKGFKVAGKTGTSNMSSKFGYDKDKYIASFIGFAPLEKPKYLVGVVLWNPDYSYRYGGKSAAPIFANIMRHLLVFKNKNNFLSNSDEVSYN